MKRILLLAATLAAFGCAQFRDLGKDDSPYANPFYAKYLNTGSALDAHITRTLAALQANPDSPALHNELGTLLVQKGFSNDAAREFEAAINNDRRFYAAWYNLGLVRAASGDEGGARRAFRRTVSHKPGHAPALFQLGLIEEKLYHTDRAVDYYAKAYSINPALMEPEVNPRVLDSKLMHLALIRMYPAGHAKKSMQFHGGSVPMERRPPPPAAAAPEAAAPQQIIPPAKPPV